MTRARIDADEVLADRGKVEPMIEVTGYACTNWVITPAALAVNEAPPAGIPATDDSYQVSPEALSSEQS